jgi:hypothetical protein
MKLKRQENYQNILVIPYFLPFIGKPPALKRNVTTGSDYAHHTPCEVKI